MSVVKNSHVSLCTYVVVVLVLSPLRVSQFTMPDRPLHCVVFMHTREVIKEQ